MQKISISQKLRYRFDNTMSKGPIALIIWLAIVSLSIIVMATLIILVFGVLPEDADEMSLFEAIWQSLMRSMDAGTVAGDAGWPYRILMLLVTLGGIFIVSTLVGVLSNGIQEKLEQLRKGRSFVVEDNHTLILGWSSKVFTIISELTIANENQKRPRIVVLANEDKTVMEDEIRDKVGNLRNTKVICRNGNPNDMTDLAIANPHAAKSIVILAPEGSGEADAETIKTILALTNNPNRKSGAYHIIAEIHEEKNLDVARIVGKDEVELVLTDDLISRIMVQTCRQSGLSVVYTELMDFDGAEIYFNAETKLFGKTYGDSLFLYKDSAVIGMQLPDGSVRVNPPMDTVYQPGSKVIAITEDDDTLVISDSAGIKVDDAAIVRAKQAEPRPEHTLILGWNSRGISIVRELENYVLPGSTLHIVSTYEDTGAAIDQIKPQLHKMKLSFTMGETTDRHLLESLGVEKYDHIIVLSYIDKLEIQPADSQTLITLLHLRHISETTGKDLGIVSEMMDIRNRELAAVTKADDFVVSDKMISLLMSQVSENKHLMRVFEDMFTSEGSEIYLKPVTGYVKTGVPVNFYTVIESARQKGESAIGYRIVADAFDPDKAYGVKINPNKPDMISFSPEDMIVVFAED